MKGITKLAESFVVFVTQTHLGVFGWVFAQDKVGVEVLWQLGQNVCRHFKHDLIARLATTGVGAGLEQLNTNTSKEIMTGGTCFILEFLKVHCHDV